MPEEKPLGALVDPDGRESDGLSKREYAELKTALAVLRRRDDGDMPYSVLNHLLIVETCGREVEEWDGLEGFLEWIDTEEGSDGILVDHRSQSSLGEDEIRVKDPVRLHGDEFRDLENMLVVLRNGGWFGRWIGTIVNSAARSDNPTGKHPTPMQVMQMLTLDNGEFKDSLEAAKELAEQRPDLLFPAPPAEPEAAPEPTVTSKPPKRQRARKARRKAA